MGLFVAALHRHPPRAIPRPFIGDPSIDFTKRDASDLGPNLEFISCFAGGCIGFELQSMGSFG